MDCIQPGYALASATIRTAEAMPDATNCRTTFEHYYYYYYYYYYCYYYYYYYY